MRVWDGYQAPAASVPSHRLCKMLTCARLFNDVVLFLLGSEPIQIHALPKTVRWFQYLFKLSCCVGRGCWLNINIVPSGGTFRTSVDPFVLFYNLRRVLFISQVTYALQQPQTVGGLYPISRWWSLQKHAVDRAGVRWQRRSLACCLRVTCISVYWYSHALQPYLLGHRH